MRKIEVNGLWVPAELIEDRKLRTKGKFLYSLIYMLSEEKHYCDYDNQAFSESLNISRAYIAQLLYLLKKRGYINIVYKYEKGSKKIKSRKIIPIKKMDFEYDENLIY